MKRPLRKINDSHHGLVAELNLTPLLDLVFVMLVIFIIATPQLTNDLAVSLPSGKTENQSKAEQIKIGGDNRIFLNEVEKSPAQLKTELAAKKSADPEVGIVIIGSEESNYQTVVNVLDIIRELNIKRVGMAASNR